MKKESELGVFILGMLLSTSLVLAQDEANIILEKIGENVVIKIIFGDPAGGFGSFAGAPLGTAGVIIIHIMIWLILFVAFSDIFGTFMPFTNKYVPWIVGFGMAVVVANFGFIPTLIGWMAAITAGFGAAAVFVSMGIAFVFFVLATFFGNKLKIAILKSKIEVASKVGSAKTAGAIEGLGKAYGAFAKASKE